MGFPSSADKLKYLHTPSGVELEDRLEMSCTMEARSIAQDCYCNFALNNW